MKSAVALFLLTALSKLRLAAGRAPEFLDPDPILGFLLGGEVLLGAAALEILVAACLLHWGTDALRSLAAVARLATVSGVYRLMAWQMDISTPCDCLGSLSGVLGLSREQAETMATGLSFYLLVGSYGLLAWVGWRSCFWGIRIK